MSDEIACLINDPPTIRRGDFITCAFCRATLGGWLAGSMGHPPAKECDCRGARVLALVREQQARLQQLEGEPREGGIAHWAEPSHGGLTAGGPRPACRMRYPGRPNPITSDRALVTCEACVIILDLREQLERETISLVYVARLEARIAELTTWRPMESAPRDGTRFIANIHGEPILIFWSEVHGYPWEVVCDCDGIHLPERAPLGWLPLPAVEVPK